MRHSPLCTLHRSDLRRIALSVALLAALAACRAPSPRVITPDLIAPPPAAHDLGDGSYDWHGLLVAPFGSVLKDIPLALHEVLLFRDQAHGSAAVDEAECYAADAPALRFVGRTLDEYLLCFKQDRLARVQASVRLPAAEASGVFIAACADWLRNAAPASTSIDAPGAAAPGAAACEGGDGAIRFLGRLEEESILSMTLDDVSIP
jgi:hypothetical protein